MKMRSRLWVMGGFLLLGMAQVAWATPDTIDDFNDATLQGWEIGRADARTPLVIEDGGRSGEAGDHALGIISTGTGGVASRLAVYNEDQWTGNFIEANLQSVRVDLKNTGETTVVIRLGFDGPGGRFVTSDSIELAAGSDWQSALFSIKPDDLVADGGTNVVATLENVGQFRIHHAPTPVFRAPRSVASLSIDNVQALEPVVVGVPSLSFWGGSLLIAALFASAILVLQSKRKLSTSA